MANSQGKFTDLLREMAHEFYRFAIWLALTLGMQIVTEDVHLYSMSSENALNLYG